MFFVSAKDEINRENFLPMAQKLFINKIKIEDVEFNFNCNEIGAKCNLDSAKAGYAQARKSFGNIILLISKKKTEQTLQFRKKNKKIKKINILIAVWNSTKYGSPG